MKADDSLPPAAVCSAKLALLRPKQLQMMRLTALGLRREQITDEVYTVTQTIDHHMAMAKTMAHAIAIAVRGGLLND